MPHTPKQAAGLAIAAGGTILGLSAAIPVMQAGLMANPLHFATCAVGLVVAGAGVCVAYGRPIVKSALDRAEHFRIENCRRDLVEQVYQMAIAHFGEGVTPPTKIRAILSRYKAGLRVGLSGLGENVKLRGYYFVFPLNKTCVNRIERYDFTVRDLQPRDIPRRINYAHALYIGAIVGDTRRSAGLLMAALQSDILTAADTRSQLVYARAATQSGVEALERHGFAPVHPRATGIDCFYKRLVQPRDDGGSALPLSSLTPSPA